MITIFYFERMSIFKGYSVSFSFQHMNPLSMLRDTPTCTHRSCWKIRQIFDFPASFAASTWAVLTLNRRMAHWRRWAPWNYVLRRVAASSPCGRCQRCQHQPWGIKKLWIFQVSLSLFKHDLWKAKLTCIPAALSIPNLSPSLLKRVSIRHTTSKMIVK